MYNININKLRLKETETLDSVVDRVEVNVSVLNETFWVSVNLPEPNVETFIPLTELTDDIIETWVWENLNLEEIDNMLLSREKEKAGSAIRQQDPETNTVSYTVRDHVKPWKVGKDYTVDEIVYYEWEEDVDTGEVDDEENPILNKVKKKKFYRVVQAHTSQEGWNPRDTASLFTDIVYFGDEDKVGYPDWQQPQGAHDAYAKNRIVEHNGQLYISDIEDNVWEPPEQWSEYTIPVIYPTWEAGVDYVSADIVEFNGTDYIALSDHTSVAEETPDIETTLWDVYVEGGGTPTVEAWVQPTGAHDAYASGEQVTHNGSTWESNVDGNVWEPPTQWTEIVE